MTEFLLSELASKVGGKIVGSGSSKIVGVCSLDESRQGHIAIVKEANLKRFENLVRSTSASALVVPSTLQLEHSALPLVLVDNPVLALRALLELFHPVARPSPGISQLASVDPSARVATSASIAPFAVVGPHAVVEDDVVLHPHVVLYAHAKVGRGAVLHAGVVVREHCQIGEYNLVQPGAVIGADGFGYVVDPSLGLVQVPQVGTVVLSPRVDIGANSCIDRATMGATRIASGCKLDNLVQVGHNVQIGEHSILCGQAGVGGSSKLGVGVVMGGQSGVADHLTIADGVRLGAQTGATSSLPAKGDYLGFPALPATLFRRIWVGLRKQSSVSKDTP